MLSYLAKKGVCRCEQVKDLEMGKLSWIMRVGHKCNHMNSYEGEAEGDFTTDRREAVGLQSRDWNDAATNQGMPAATRNWKRQDRDFPLEPQEEVELDLTI